MEHMGRETFGPLFHTIFETFDALTLIFHERDLCHVFQGLC